MTLRPLRPRLHARSNTPTKRNRGAWIHCISMGTNTFSKIEMKNIKRMIPAIVPLALKGTYIRNFLKWYQMLRLVTNQMTLTCRDSYGFKRPTQWVKLKHLHQFDTYYQPILDKQQLNWKRMLQNGWPPVASLKRNILMLVHAYLTVSDNTYTHVVNSEEICSTRDSQRIKRRGTYIYIDSITQCFNAVTLQAWLHYSGARSKMEANPELYPALVQTAMQMGENNEYAEIIQRGKCSLIHFEFAWKALIDPFLQRSSSHVSRQFKVCMYQPSKQHYNDRNREQHQTAIAAPHLTSVQPAFTSNWILSITQLSRWLLLVILQDWAGGVLDAGHHSARLFAWKYVRRYYGRCKYRSIRLDDVGLRAYSRDLEQDLDLLWLLLGGR